MHPIERLRYVARSVGAAPTEVAAEAAEALAGLALEPRALVLACRRLLDAQPDNAPLWWVAAHVLASPEPAKAARSCAQRLAGDLTSLELAYSVAAGATVAAEASPSLLEALSERPDCSLRLVGAPVDLRFSLASLAEGVAGGPGALGFAPEEAEDAVEGATVAVVEAVAASASRVLLRPAGAALAEAADARGIALWVAAGTGRVLPEVLFDRCTDGASGTVRRADLVDKVATEQGLLAPAAAFDPGDCPAPASLAAAPRR